MTRQALLVLGMHRSGTSALAGLLARLGAAVPRSLMPADHNNPAGYWESSALCGFHERLLRIAGTAWDAWTPIDLAPAEEARFAEEGRQLIATEYGDADLLVVKDPRLCRLVPFWLRLLDSAAIEPGVLVMFREPGEVAASLRARDGLTSDRALLLWLRHVLDAERHTRGRRRCLVTYGQLLEDWRGVVHRCTQQLAIRWPARASAGVNAVIQPGLQHQAGVVDALPDGGAIADWVTAVREACQRLVCDDDETGVSGAYETLDRVSGELDAAAGAVGLAEERDRARLVESLQAEHARQRRLADDDWSARLHSLEEERSRFQRGLRRSEEELERLRAQVAAGDAEAARLRIRLEELLASRSWKMTLPLRVVWELISRPPPAAASEPDQGPARRAPRRPAEHQ